jgi:hypothetical protein
VPPSSSVVGRCASVWSYYLVHASGHVNCYYPTKGCTLDVHALRKVSTEVSNLSKGEMSFNFSLRISIQVSTTIHRPARGASSGGPTCSLCLALYAIMFIELCFNFMSIFCVFLPSCGQLLSPCPATSLSCAILSQAGLLEVHATYLGSLDYFLGQGPVLPNGCSSEKSKC